MTKKRETSEEWRLSNGVCNILRKVANCNLWFYASDMSGAEIQSLNFKLKFSHIQSSLALDYSLMLL